MSNVLSDGTMGYLTGQLLVAMPQMQDSRFSRSVIYLCAHTADGAMGLVVNKLMDSLSFPDLLDQLNIDTGHVDQEIRIHFGGPVETGRGFVLHSADYQQDATLEIDRNVALTATIDILRSIAEGDGPRQHLLALGYAGWEAGQLDREIQDNGWLCVPPDDDLLFGTNLDNRWEAAIGKLGVDISMLSGEAGRA